MTPTPPAPVPAQVDDAPRPGLFITFEGGDGVGKSTQIDRLATLLVAAHLEYVRTREPGGTELGTEIRRLLLDGGHVDPRAEALLYAADRAHHVTTKVRPALEAGSVVISDRYLDSSVAYQGAARDLGPGEVRDLSLWATDGLLPDLTILLDAEPGLAERRRTARGGKDRLEREPGAFHQALREEFLALAALEPERFVVIDAEQDLETVARLVAVNVARLVARRGSGLRTEVHEGADDVAAREGGSPSAALRAAVLRRYPELHAAELDA